MNDKMELLKHIDSTSLLIPFEQLYIKTYHHHKQLIPEQHTNEHNPMYQLIHDLRNTSRPTKPIDQ